MGLETKASKSIELDLFQRRANMYHEICQAQIFCFVPLEVSFGVFAIHEKCEALSRPAVMYAQYTAKLAWEANQYP